jgi:hypothetical protein
MDAEDFAAQCVCVDLVANFGGEAEEGGGLIGELHLREFVG